MSWDVAFVGSLAFPSAAKRTAWRTRPIELARFEEVAKQLAVHGVPPNASSEAATVGDVLDRLAATELALCELLEDKRHLRVRLVLHEDAYLDQGAALIAALRAAKEHGALGTIEGLGFLTATFGVRIDVGDGTVELLTEKEIAASEGTIAELEEAVADHVAAQGTPSEPDVLTPEGIEHHITLLLTTNDHEGISHRALAAGPVGTSAQMVARVASWVGSPPGDHHYHAFFAVLAQRGEAVPEADTLLPMLLEPTRYDVYDYVNRMEQAILVLRAPALLRALAEPVLELFSGASHAYSKERRFSAMALYLLDPALAFEQLAPLSRRPRGVLEDGAGQRAAEIFMHQRMQRFGLFTVSETMVNPLDPRWVEVLAGWLDDEPTEPAMDQATINLTYLGDARGKAALLRVLQNGHLSTTAREAAIYTGDAALAPALRAAAKRSKDRTAAKSWAAAAKKLEAS
jgi:hypothetical protein